MTIRILKSYYKFTVQLVKHMSETTAPVLKEKVRYDGRIKKRNWEERRSDAGVTDDDKKRSKIVDGVKIKRRKYAMLISYSGADYYGMQRNPQMKTIEEDLLTALLKVDLITEDAYNQIQTIQFQRAARTDKGVSAARQVVSLKLPETMDISTVNKELPEKICVFSVKRVTKGFNSKSNCDARTYIYLLPTLAFSNFREEATPEIFRLSENALKEINNVLQLFVGTKNFHNFTSKKNFKDPSAMRYILSFECEKPFVRKGVEFAIIKVKGQSFMLHQIRKMIGLTVAIIRGHATIDTITQAYSADRLDLPMAPGLGLVLDQVHYDRYNARYGKDHDTLDWPECDSEIEAFKEKHIYPTIIDAEIDEKPMVAWLETLPKHSFSVRLDQCEDEDKNEEINADYNEDSNKNDDSKNEDNTKCNDDDIKEENYRKTDKMEIGVAANAQNSLKS